jgi:hypothetical protein
MTGHRPFNELTKDFSPERRARVVARVSQLKAYMPLHELRPPRERSPDESRVTGTNDLPSRTK